MMHRYDVYHATNLLQMMFHDAAQWRHDRAAHYRRVAEVLVEASDKPLERIFRLTNHLDEHPWTQNPEVVWYDPTRPIRSTSVGDVVVQIATGETWMVLPFGWNKVEQP